MPSLARCNYRANCRRNQSTNEVRFSTRTARKASFCNFVTKCANYARYSPKIFFPFRGNACRGAHTAPYNNKSEPIPHGIKFGSCCNGGPGGIRTLDLSDANRTLSQLSYRPSSDDLLILFHSGGIVKGVNAKKIRRGKRSCKNRGLSAIFCVFRLHLQEK